MTDQAPSGCRRCGHPERLHGTWYTVNGKHVYDPPTLSQIKARMLSRRLTGGSAMTCEECPPQVTCGSVVCTVRRSLWNYPTLHKNRTEVLHYLLCEIGNGFEWSRDGRLLEIGYQVYPDDYGLEGVKTDPDESPFYNTKECDPEWYAELKAEKDAERAELEQIRADVETLARTGVESLPEDRVCDESRDYGRLFTMPGNAMPDWRAAAEEIRAVVEPVWAERRARDAAVEAAPAVADRLDAAADLLAARAAAATPGPWWRPLDVRNKAAIFATLPEGETGRWKEGFDPFLERRESCVVLECVTWSDGSHDRRRSGRDLEWAAMMNPLLGPALASLLRREAERIRPMYKRVQIDQVDGALLGIAAVILASDEDRPPSR